MRTPKWAPLGVCAVLALALGLARAADPAPRGQRSATPPAVTAAISPAGEALLAGQRVATLPTVTARISPARAEVGQPELPPVLARNQRSATLPTVMARTSPARVAAEQAATAPLGTGSLPANKTAPR
jgi:hypothetical protein